MEGSAKHDFLLITTIEVALVGLFSIVSVCIYSVILWTSLTSIGNDEEDRWSFKRSMKAVTLIAIVQNIYQVVFLIVQTTNITFNLLENVNTATKTTEAFSAIDQLFYCNFVYFLALALMKPLVWPRLRFDTYIYLITSVPAILNAIVRFTLILDMEHMDHSTQTSVMTATSVVTSFIIYLVPLTIVIISTVTSSRRQPEHFMKVSCQRMGIIFSVHLVISAVHFFIYSLVQCHKYDYNVQNHQWICVDHLTEADRQEDWNPRNHTSTTIPPDPSTSPTPINIAQMVLNVVSQLLLPLIPASFLYTIRTILLE